MAETRQFSTGGGFPSENSPGRTIQFTLSYGQSELFNPDDDTRRPDQYRIEFSNPEDRAYVCAMYGPPRDKNGLKAFADQLAVAYKKASEDPSYVKLPVPPLPFSPGDDEKKPSFKLNRELLRRAAFGHNNSPRILILLSISPMVGVRKRFERRRLMATGWWPNNLVRSMTPGTFLFLARAPYY
jgi:hypothetical protein